jgi:hypothetical protein
MRVRRSAASRSVFGAGLAACLALFGSTLPFTLGSTPPAASATANHTPEEPSVDSTGGVLYVGKPHFTKILASGWPRPTLSEAGPLPSGVTFTPMNGFALLSGTPAPGTGNDYTVMITATNNQGSDTEPYDLTVVQNPVYPSNFCPSPVTVGQYFHDAETVVDYPVFFGLGLNNSPPDNIIFDQDFNNEDLGYLSGTPAPGQGGTYPLSYGADNNVTPGTKNLRCLLTIDEAPSFTDTGMTTLTAGAKLSTPTGPTGTTGFPREVTIGESGVLPTGLTTRTKAGRKTFAYQLTGKPAVGTEGDYLLALTADNGTGGPQTEDYVAVITSSATAQQATTTTLDGATSTNYETPVTYTATVNGGVAATGYVQFQISGLDDGGVTPIDTVPLVGGQATFTTPSSLDVGNNYVVTATYTGDPNNASSSTSSALTIAPVPTTLTLNGPASTSFGVPATFTAVATSTAGTPQGFVEFDLNGQVYDVDVDNTGTATFTTDPTLLGSGSPWEVDATFNAYVDAPGDWSQSDMQSADYNIGPIDLDTSVGDGNSSDPIVAAPNNGVVTVDPSAATEISVNLAPELGGTVPAEAVTIDISGPDGDDTAQLNLTAEEDAPTADLETGLTDYFWTIAPGSLTALLETSATVTINYGGDDQFAPSTETFTLQW